MRAQLAWTTVTELIVLASGVVVLKLAASNLGLAGFGEYAISRRAVGLLYLPLVMGLGIAAPRYMAVARAGGMQGFSESAFAIAALGAGLVPPLAAVLALNLVPAWSATVLFGSAPLATLVVPVTVALAGIALHNLIYAIYRGRLEMGFANVLQLVNLGVIPVGAFFLGEGTAASVLAATGTGWLVVSSAALAHVLIRERAGLRGLSKLREHMRILLRFGLPRVPGEFALIGLFAIPSLVAVRIHGIEAAGQFSAALSVLTMVSAAFAPIGLVLLPRASAQAATGDLAGLRRLVVRVLAWGVLLGTSAVILGELLLPRFILWYFGPPFLSAVPIFRACLIGAIPYVVYVLLRNVLDALNVKALNSRNLIIAFAAVLTLCLMKPSILWMSFGVVASLVLLGVLTVRDTYRQLRTPVPASATTDSALPE